MSEFASWGPWRRRWLQWLARPHADVWIIAVAVLLVTPSLGVGFAADDAMLRVRGVGGPRFDGLAPSTWDLFVFVRDDPQQRASLLDGGMLAWWVAPHYRLGFLRPLSSLTHALDLVLWPRSSSAMLVHSFVYFAAMLAAARAVFRRLLPPIVATVALALFALDDARGPVVGYISNRNALLMATAGFAALWLHDRWRRDGSRAAAVAAPASLGVGLLAGEGTIAMLGYLGAHALAFERGPLLTRARVLLPYLLVVVPWIAAYRMGGYGGSGSDIYIDPSGDPLAFATVLPGRVLALLGAQLLGPWSDFWLAWPRGIAIALAAWYAAVVAITAALVWRRAAARGVAGLFALGATLACVPLAGTFPADRLLGFVGLGGAAIVAMVLVGKPDAAPPRRAERGALALLWFVHAVLAVALLPVRARSMATVREALATLDRTVPREPAITEHEVIAAFAPNDGPGSYLVFTRIADGEPAPIAARTLATSTGPVRFVRVDERTLRVEASDGLLTTPVERMVRSLRVPFAVGDRMPLSGPDCGGTVAIEAVTDDGRPRVVRFELPRSLDDPRYLWRVWRREGFVPWQPPPPGGSETLAGFDLAHAAAVAAGLEP
ncbi:MAG: hypothetical protein K1X88_03150 [Nannocystaceae bacterium]|nr:hypothetical protein [Nannocystaceae bacterium]